MKHKAYPIVIFVALFLGFTIRFAEAATAKPVRVTLVPIKNDKLDIRIKSVGKLTPDIEELSFKIPGRISKLLVNEGDYVEKGQALAKLEKDDAVDLQAQQKLVLAQALRKFQRIKSLYEEDSVCLDDYEDARDSFTQAQIAYDQANLCVERCVLPAPDDGVILARYLDYLTSVVPGMPIYSFKSSNRPWIVKMNLPDYQAFSLENGCAAELTFAPYSRTPICGTVTRTAQKANPLDGLYEVELTIVPGTDMVLKPGLLAHVVLCKKSKETYSIVPLSALLGLNGKAGHIFIADTRRNCAIRKAITVRSISGADVALEEDLSAFNYVITHGNQYVEDLAPIEFSN